jgi:hypothetical protein
MLRRRQWRALYDSDAADPGLVAGVRRGDDPAASMKALKDELGDDFDRLRVGEQAWAHAVTPDREVIAWLLRHPDADRLRRFKSAITGGVELAAQQQSDDVLGLTAQAVSDIFAADQHAKKAQMFQVSIRLLSDGGHARSWTYGHQRHRFASADGRSVVSGGLPTLGKGRHGRHG